MPRRCSRRPCSTADGNLQTSTLAEYLVPAASDVPSLKLDQTVTPSPTNPLGVKGIGEAGTIGAAPAVINAIVDALSGLGVSNVPMPASPLNVWKAIHGTTTEDRHDRRSASTRRHGRTPPPHQRETSHEPFDDASDRAPARERPTACMAGERNDGDGQ